MKLLLAVNVDTQALPFDYRYKVTGARLSLRGRAAAPGWSSESDLSLTAWSTSGESWSPEFGAGGPLVGCWCIFKTKWNAVPLV